MSARSLTLVVAVILSGCLSAPPPGDAADPGKGTASTTPPAAVEGNRIDPPCPPFGPEGKPPADAPPECRDPNPFPSGPEELGSGEPGVFPGAYLLAFHQCDPAAGCQDTRQHVTHLAYSDDGRSWSMAEGFKGWTGSVPDVVRRGDVVYVYNPGQLHRYHVDTGEWEAADRVEVVGPDGTPVEGGFVDPSLIVDESGRITMFYLPGVIGQDPAGCPAGESPCAKVIRSATEAEGSDGTRFVLDGGDRVSIVVDHGASDPDVFPHPGGFVLYVSEGPSVRAFTSTSLRGTYEPVAGLPEGRLSHQAGGVPAGHYDDTTGRYWTYVHSSTAQGAVIKRAVHASLGQPLEASDLEVVVAHGTIAGLSGAGFESPSFAVNGP